MYIWSLLYDTFTKMPVHYAALTLYEEVLCIVIWKQCSLGWFMIGTIGNALCVYEINKVECLD